jgi:hypothetical protein
MPLKPVAASAQIGTVCVGWFFMVHPCAGSKSHVRAGASGQAGVHGCPLTLARLRMPATLFGAAGRIAARHGVGRHRRVQGDTCSDQQHGDDQRVEE